MTGQAVPRSSVPGASSRLIIRQGYPYWGYYGSPWYYGGYNSLYPGFWGYDYWGLGWGWGFGLGSFYYGPYSGWGGYYGDMGYYGGYPGYAGYGTYSSGRVSDWYYTGNLKLKVRPKTAEVYVDGYYVGIVDDFDGVFQELTLTADPNAAVVHKVEIRAPGAQPIVFEVRLQPGQVITYRGDLVGATQSVR